ncbi:MAG: hypothetical protein ACYC63_01330 [Armatimonadota bacterium]
MSKFVPILIVVLLVAITVGAILYAVRRQPAETELPEPAVAQTEEKAEPQGVHVAGAQIEQKDASGKLEWKVSAGGEMKFDKDRQNATGQNVKFELVQSGKAPIIVTAQVFEANYGARKLTFSEGVAGRMSDGSSHFAVSRLEYDLGSRKLVGSGGARFTQGLYTTTAEQIVVDPAHKKVRLKGGIKFSRG